MEKLTRTIAHPRLQTRRVSYLNLYREPYIFVTLFEVYLVTVEDVRGLCECWSSQKVSKIITRALSEKAFLMIKTKIKRIVFITLGHSSQKITGLVFSATQVSFCVATAADYHKNV